MFLWLCQWLASEIADGSTTLILRAAAAACFTFFLAVVSGRPAIAWLHSRFREPIKSASPIVARLHAAKQSTPTMGGLFIVAEILLSAILFARLFDPLVGIALLLTVALTALGAADDLTKLLTPRRGLAARSKLGFQILISGAAALGVFCVHLQTPGALVIGWPGGSPNAFGWLFVPMAISVLVASSNAVNLTDGLDGLAGGCLLCATTAMAALCFASGNRAWADALQLTYIPSAGEVGIVAAAMIGGVLGFLRFNCHPASVFMGNTGALPLGGLLGYLAIACRQELIFVVIAGVFVAETASVILQVASYKLCRRRIFLCAPLHHHFQFLGWSETAIVKRFWVAAAITGLLGWGLVDLSAHRQRHRPDAGTTAWLVPPAAADEWGGR